jgi:hypothetical protein
VALINPRDGAQAVECGDCQADNFFTLNHVPFTPVRPLFIRTVALPVKDQHIPLGDAFSRLRSVLPVPESALRLPWSGADGTISLSSSDEVCNSGKLTQATLPDWGQHQSFAGGASVNRVVGVTDNPCQPGGTFHEVPPSGLPLQDYPYSVVAASRPLTSVAHEIFHGFGQPHAGPRCPGKPGDGLSTGGANPSGAGDWPPDQQGMLNGVGLDVHHTAAGTLNSYTIVAPQPGWDFMSYCVGLLGSDTMAWEAHSWISPRTWDQVVQKLVLPGSHVARRAARRAIANGAGRRNVLRVVATLKGSSAKIVDVAPTIAQPTSSSVGAPYQLMVRDSAGHPLHSAAVWQTATHVSFAAPAYALVADLPAAGAASVEIRRAGASIARRVRPLHAPVIKVVSPRHRDVTGKCRNSGSQCVVAIRYRITDQDRSRLTVAIDYSRGGTRAWRTLHVGPGGTGSQTTNLPARLLSRSAHARVRIRVSDGFNEASALSRDFESTGASPAVQILSPISGARVRSDASIHLLGQAVDDAGHVLVGRRLRWHAGRRLLGTGAALTLSNLPGGAKRITLTARDRYGRTARASVAVKIHRDRPRFLLATAPRKLSPRAGSLPLRIAALSPARLTVSGHGVQRLRTQVGPTARRLKVKITPGTTPVLLKLQLANDNMKTTLRLTVQR